MDLNLEGIPVVTEFAMRLVPVVAVRQNVYPVKGKGLAVHGGKTATALRIVPLPLFVTSRLNLRIRGDERPEWPVFAAAGRNGETDVPLAVRGAAQRSHDPRPGRSDCSAHLAPNLRRHPRRRDEPHRPR